MHFRFSDKIPKSHEVSRIHGLKVFCSPVVFFYYYYHIWYPFPNPGTFLFRQSWCAFWLRLRGMLSALRRHAFFCEEVFFCWSEWDAEGLLCTYKGTPGLNFTTLCSLAPEDVWFFSCAVNLHGPHRLSETIHISYVLHLPFLPLSMHTLSPSALFMLPHSPLKVKNMHQFS